MGSVRSDLPDFELGLCLGVGLLLGAGRCAAAAAADLVDEEPEAGDEGHVERGQDEGGSHEPAQQLHEGRPSE